MCVVFCFFCFFFYSCTYYKIIFQKKESCVQSRGLLLGPLNLAPCLQRSSKTFVHGLRQILGLRVFWCTHFCCCFFKKNQKKKPTKQISPDATQLFAATYTRHVCLHPWSEIVPPLSLYLSGDTSICQRDRLQSGLSDSLIYYVPRLYSCDLRRGWGCSLIDCHRKVLDWPANPVPYTAVCRHSVHAGFALISLIRLSFTWDMAFLQAHPSFYLSLLDETTWSTPTIPPTPHLPFP